MSDWYDRYDERWQRANLKPVHEADHPAVAARAQSLREQLGLPSPAPWPPAAVPESSPGASGHLQAGEAAGLAVAALVASLAVGLAGGLAWGLRKVLARLRDIQ